MRDAFYDTIGAAYTATRREGPRIAARIRAALGDAASVVNVGAGAGAYEPSDLEVLAVEPSETMLAQRPPDAAPAVKGSAEALPLADRSFDVAMAVLSDHHWQDRSRGLRELRRVARDRVVLFNADQALARRFWLVRDYLPGFLRLIPAEYHVPGHWAEELTRELGPVRLEPVPIPCDCRDGFFGAWWRSPEAYLDERVRAGISVFARLSPAEIERGLAALAADLRSGAWRRRYPNLLRQDELDLGYRLVVARLLQ